MKTRIQNFVIALISLFFLTSCLEERAAEIPLSLQAPVTYFDGVKTVRNLGGYPISIEVTWDPTPVAIKYNIYAVTRDPISGLISFNLVDVVTDPSQGTYIHRDSQILTAGNVYTYRVNAVDATGMEDGNLVQKSTVAFEGIQRVDILSKTTARLLVSTAGSFSRIRVMAHPIRLPSTNLTQTVSKTFNSSDSSFILENLKPGTTYSFIANVQIDDLGNSDGNTLGKIEQTASDSFGTGNSAETTANYQFRNVRLVQAFGDAPNEINRTSFPNGSPPELTEAVNPHVKMVKIIPNPFSVVHTGKFRIVRIAGVGNTIPSQANFDLTTTTVCREPQTSPVAPATATACVVCDHNANRNASGTVAINNGECDLAINTIPPTFIDKALDPPPRKYFYTITKVNEYLTNGVTVRWPEELPTQNYAEFTFAAHIPDKYMVLVQRESVNYDMCRMLNKATDPRKNNHCAYRGIGATPYTTKGVKINLPDGYYDFGYNIMIDRHALACNWSRPQPAVAHPCGPRGCFSLGTNEGAGSGFKSDSDSPTPYGAPTNLSTAMIPSVNVNTSGIASSPLALFNLQTQGNNCYLAYYSQTTLAGNPAATPPTTIMGASWTSVGRLASLAFSMSDVTQLATKTEIASMVAIVATADPGPLGGTSGTSSVWADRKRPVITGLSNTQAQALCSFQNSSYGKKRLMRRREYMAVTAFPSTSGEPNYVNQTTLNNIMNGSQGQTLYTWNATDSGFPDGSYGDGTRAGVGQNPGGCATGGAVGRARITANPAYCADRTAGFNAVCNTSYNNVVPKLSPSYCNITGGCSVTENADTQESQFKTLNYTGYWKENDGMSDIAFANGTDGGTYTDIYLDPRNENAQVTRNNSIGGNSNSNAFFIGSLATNKCLSRYGSQDPFSSASAGNGGGIYAGDRAPSGIFFSDQFRQTSNASMGSNSPVFEPFNNSLDLGVANDYRYPNPSNTNQLIDIKFSNGTDGYSLSGHNGSASATCTALDGSQETWFTDNFFYLTSTSTAGINITQAYCPSPVNNSTRLTLDPQRNNADFPGYLPILGLPLSRATQINGNQDQVDFNNFLFSNQFGATPATQNTRVRFYATAYNEVVNMTSGVGSRWSFEISSSDSDINNQGQAWCAVEAE